METLTLVVVATGLLSAAFILGGIFGATVYHFARKQAEKVAKAVTDAVNKSAAAADHAAAAVNSAASKL